jgi:glycerate 2-kinase
MTFAASSASPRALLEDLYRAAVTAAAPGPALAKVLASIAPEPKRRVFILSLGKAAHPMAAAAIELLSRRGLAPAGGLIVSPEADTSPHPALQSVAGDHPRPGAASLAAASALENAVSRIGAEDEAWVLLSGGTTSLIAAPIAGVAPADLSLLYEQLLGSGLDISAMNRIRKRFSRWGAGRLAAALAPACVKSFTISDVIGDDLASIGSGPCVPDESSASEVRSALASAGLWEEIPASVKNALEAVLQGQSPETPKPGDPAFEKVQTIVFASNRLAVEAAAARATELGLHPHILDTALAGEAGPTGRRLAGLLLSYPETGIPQPGGLHKNSECLIWGGETTVTLGPDPGLGGRNQELALAAAEVLAGADGRTGGQAAGVGPALLSAGTDGRDGPTDAAGAIVDSTTWQAVRKAGRDPAAYLARHDAYHALDAAGALLRPGLTGTNVMDIVIGLR